MHRTLLVECGAELCSAYGQMRISKRALQVIPEQPPHLKANNHDACSPGSRLCFVALQGARVVHFHAAQVSRLNNAFKVQRAAICEDSAGGLMALGT